MLFSKKHPWFGMILGIGLLTTTAQVRAAGLYADIVVYNGKILTLDNADPNNFRTAQAAAIYRGEFVAVGTNDEVLQLAGPETRKIDVAGRMVLPGIVETHDHIYGGASHFFPAAKPRVGQTDPPITFTTKDEFLAQLRTIVLRKKPGEWIITSPRSGREGFPVELQRGEVTIQDLDRVAPDNPVYLHWNVTVEGLANSKALLPMLERYPKIVGVRRDANGNLTGRLGGVANLTIWYEYWPQVPPEELGPYYRMEMEELAAQGLTTVSTRLFPNHLAAYSWIHNRNELPLRMAYSLEPAARSEITEATLARIVGLQGGKGAGMWGTGDNKLWAIGIAPISADSVTGVAGSCVNKEFPRENRNFPLWRYQFYGPMGECRLKSPDYHDIDVFRAAGKYGFRISAVHISGDRAIDQYLDVMDELIAQYPHVAEQRWGIDHCQIVHEEQARRAKRLGVMFSCGPTFLYGGDKGAVGAFGVLYGEEVAGEAVIPFRRLIDAGLHPVMELDRHAFHPFLALQITINRKDQSGKIWGPKQRISRTEALYTYTRWAAEYLLRENYLGSIEPGRAGDLVVLNRDYLTTPEDEIGQIDPLLTVMDGKITYTDPQFAASAGLPVVGYQGDRSRWTRGKPGEGGGGGPND
jgi:predicted amidohydrolase YtcJ